EIEGLLHLLVNDEGLRAALKRGLHAAKTGVERQVGDDADLRLLLARQLVDEAGQIVFEIALAILAEQRNDLAAIDHIGADKTEIKRVAANRRGGYAFGDRQILFVGQGLGIDDLQLQLAVRVADIFLQEI